VKGPYGEPFPWGENVILSILKEKGPEWGVGGGEGGKERNPKDPGRYFLGVLFQGDELRFFCKIQAPKFSEKEGTLNSNTVLSKLFYHTKGLKQQGRRLLMTHGGLCLFRRGVLILSFKPSGERKFQQFHLRPREGLCRPRRGKGRGGLGGAVNWGNVNFRRKKGSAGIKGPTEGNFTTTVKTSPPPRRILRIERELDGHYTDGGKGAKLAWGGLRSFSPMKGCKGRIK